MSIVVFYVSINSSAIEFFDEGHRNEKEFARIYEQLMLLELSEYLIKPGCLSDLTSASEFKSLVENLLTDNMYINHDRDVPLSPVVKAKKTRKRKDRAPEQAIAQVYRNTN